MLGVRLSCPSFPAGPSGAEDGACCFIPLLTPSFTFASLASTLLSTFLHASFFLGFPVHRLPGLRDSSLTRDCSSTCSRWYCPFPLVVKARGQKTGSGSTGADSDSLIFGGLSAVCVQSMIPMAQFLVPL